MPLMIIFCASAADADIAAYADTPCDHLFIRRDADAAMPLRFDIDSHAFWLRFRLLPCRCHIYDAS